MRKLVLKMSMTLDGFVCGPNGELDWPDVDDARATAWTMESLRETDFHVVGARTYAEMAAYWPTSDGPFAESMNTVPKIVFSRSGKVERSGFKDEPRIAMDLRGEIVRLKREEGNVLLAHGGATFAQELVASGLVDEFRLLVHPIAIGTGKALFSKVSSMQTLQLVRAIPFENGAIAQIYRYA